MLFFLNTVIQFLFYYSQIKCTKRTINVQSEFVYRVFQCIYWGLKINIRSEWIDCVNADLTFLNILIDSQSIFCLFISTLETRMTKCGYMRISTCLPLGERRTCWFWRTSKIWARRMTTGEKSTALCHYI